LVARIAEQRRKLFAACRRAGAGYEFLPPPDARPWVVRLARERGHEVAAPAAAELIERTGADLGVLDGEIEKLSLHVGAGVRIEPQHVRALVGDGRDRDARELSDRIARRDLPGAARLLRDLLAQGEPPIKLLAFLAGNVRRALHVTELVEQGLRPDEIAGRLGMSPNAIAFFARRGPAVDLERTLLVLGRLDLELKSGRDEEACFDAALLEIASA